jgi:hypothetical protein
MRGSRDLRKPACNKKKELLWRENKVFLPENRSGISRKDLTLKVRVKLRGDLCDGKWYTKRTFFRCVFKDIRIRNDEYCWKVLSQGMA